PHATARGTARMAALLAAAACCAAVLAGCGAPARPLELAITDIDTLQLRSWVSPQMRRNVALLPVTGGEETSRWWGTRISTMSLNQAYQESLHRLGLLPDVPTAGRYQLRVEVLALAQPQVPVGPEVAIAIRYTLTERSSSAVLYQRVLRNSQKAGIDDSLNPTEQLRMATEAVLRANIGDLIRDLASLPLPQ
ncbi:MAG: hypothetical protein ABW220_07925, partial [Burkholderiaceae bacterium]